MESHDKLVDTIRTDPCTANLTDVNNKRKLEDMAIRDVHHQVSVQISPTGYVGLILRSTTVATASRSRPTFEARVL